MPEGPREGAKMGHMAQSVCARMLASEGRIKVHNSNGTICAVFEECVYMTCANGKDRITDLGCGKVEVVNKYTTNTGADESQTPAVTCFCRGCVHWVKLTQQSWKTLNATPQG